MKAVTHSFHNLEDKAKWIFSKNRASDWLSSHRSKALISQQIILLEEIPIKAINTEHAFHLAVETSIEELRLNPKLTTHISLHGLESIRTAHQDP